MDPLPVSTLPAGIRSRVVPAVNGLSMHILEAGYAERGRPCLLLLHGFPELAYSWRKVMLPLAAAGFHVVAPDQRGYGRTTGWDSAYDGDLLSFRLTNLVRDALALVSALGYREAAAAAGHDFGASVAAYAALIRPDVFRAVALMSAPFAGPPTLPFATDRAPPPTAASEPDIHAALAALDPGRKHYQWYYSTREANGDMWHCRQGVHDFLRAYYHHKSADWTENRPFKLASWSAAELAKMPTYYILERDRTMAETVAAAMPSAASIASCRWLPDDELRIYSGEYERTGFQGGLQWYRCVTMGWPNGDLEIFSGRAIDVPSLFIAGGSDWGVRQKPGALERMQSTACKRMLGCHLIDGAGHWVQQERPEEVARLLGDFLDQSR
jgi:pimeloyl-ACP methyl ester carboxylesterase